MNISELLRTCESTSGNTELSAGCRQHGLNCYLCTTILRFGLRSSGLWYLAEYYETRRCREVYLSTPSVAKLFSVGDS